MTIATIARPDSDLCAKYEESVRKMTGATKLAYVPTRDAGAWILSIVVDGVTGYYPMPVHFCHGSEAQMQQIADHLNHTRLNRSRVQVAHLIAQSSGVI